LNGSKGDAGNQPTEIDQRSALDPKSEGFVDRSVDALLTFYSGESAKNPNAGILGISKQPSHIQTFTINADQTDRRLTLIKYTSVLT
jgi:hypothetical protein